MKLRCVSRYRSDLGSFKPGEVFDVPDDIAGHIMRSSPESFEIVQPELPKSPVAKEPVETRPDLSAMSEATETGIVAPDRRMRGGRRRAKK